LLTCHTTYTGCFLYIKNGDKKIAHQAKIQAIIAAIGISWLKTLKEWEAKKSGDWFEPALNIHVPFSPSLTPIFFISPSSTQ
jgi:hypothetical protein